MDKICLILFLNILLALKGLSTQTVVIPGDAADEAETALDNFRLVVAYSLYEETVLYANFSKILDTTAFATKAETIKQMQEINKNFGSQFEFISDLSLDKEKSRFEFDFVKGLEEIYIADVTDCVNFFVNQSIEFMYEERTGYMKFPLECIALLEKEKIACGKTDDVCLKKLIKNINHYIIQVPEDMHMSDRYVDMMMDGWISRIQSCKEQTFSRFQEAIAAALDRINKAELYKRNT